MAVLVFPLLSACGAALAQAQQAPTKRIMQCPESSGHFALGNATGRVADTNFFVENNWVLTLRPGSTRSSDGTPPGFEVTYVSGALTRDENTNTQIVSHGNRNVVVYCSYVAAQIVGQKLTGSQALTLRGAISGVQNCRIVGRDYALSPGCQGKDCRVECDAGPVGAGRAISHAGAIYLMGASGQKHHIASMDVYNGCGGLPATQAVDARTANAIATGAALTTAAGCVAARNAAWEGKPIQAGQSPVFLFASGRKHGITDMPTFTNCGLAGEDILQISAAALNGIPDGKTLSDKTLHECEALRGFVLKQPVTTAPAPTAPAPTAPVPPVAKDLVIDGCKLAPGAQCQGKRIGNANLTGANLSGASFEGANLAGVNLSRANLQKVNFINADLTQAVLGGADLRGAALSAKLQNANLQGALIDGAIFSFAQLEGAVWIDGSRCGPGSVGTCKPKQ